VRDKLLQDDDILKKLFLPLTTLDNVGQKMEEALLRLNCRVMIDLIFYLPYHLNQFQYLPDLAKVASGSNIITKLVVHDVMQPGRMSYGSKKNIIKIFCSNNTGHVNLTYFNYYPSYLLQKINTGTELLVKGKIERYFGQLVMSHPEILTNTTNVSATEPQYHLTYGLINKQLIKYIQGALTYLPNFYEWLPEEYLQKHGLLAFNEAIKKAHHPTNLQDLEPASPIIRRLAFDELLAHQLAVKLVRKNMLQLTKGMNLEFTGQLAKKLQDSLPFALTNCQKRTIAEIANEQHGAHNMIRLVQGDVGSGKTIVALMAMLNVVEAKKQACLMAPTDLLVTQHYHSIEAATASLGINIALITGKIKGKAREKILANLASSEIDIIIGTHALFEENVIFANLALIVIDEQHRFGVEQRLALISKNHTCDLLLMSATPIPRTLTMVLYGDMALSQITEKPAHRLPIITSVMPISKEKELIHAMEKILAKNEKIYWICPLIEENQESEKNSHNLKAAISRHNELRAAFGDGVGLIHGKMSNQDKSQAMQDFVAGNIKILVATTVIEVGIDVKDASLIIIEHAERFGLSQLHQLRGRVGRSNLQSYCILLYHYPISNEAKMRLNIMRQTNDGFIIAEEDLKLRGAGDLLGTKQSGIKDFKFADLMCHQDLLASASILSSEVAACDSKLANQYKALRILLYIFGYHQALKYLKS
jgi:ATP-dependent DNA helicase RecG